MLFTMEPHRIYALDDTGALLAEITYPLVREGVVDINHTFVSPSLRGQGIAGRLMRTAVADIEKNHLKITASCPYAVTWLQKHTAFSSMLADDPYHPDTTCKLP